MYETCNAEAVTQLEATGFKLPEGKTWNSQSARMSLFDLKWIGSTSNTGYAGAQAALKGPEGTCYAFAEATGRVSIYTAMGVELYSGRVGPSDDESPLLMAAMEAVSDEAHNMDMEAFTK